MVKGTNLFIVFCLLFYGSCLNRGRSGSESELPERGLCAHRGAMVTHPENTLSSFRAAVASGAQMIEFDVWLTKDNRMVVIHDATVDRTTDGTGKVSEFTLAEIKKMDAGKWKAAEFTGEQIPTLEEVLQVLPLNIWLNIHVKGEGELPVMVARLIAREKRLQQAFLACKISAAKEARKAVPGIMICNMERQNSPRDYVAETIRLKTEFIQLNRSEYPEFAADVKSLKDNGIRVNYYGTDSLGVIKMLFEKGVDFPLVNDCVRLMDHTAELGFQPVLPLFKK